MILFTSFDNVQRYRIVSFLVTKNEIMPIGYQVKFLDAITQRFSKSNKTLR